MKNYILLWVCLWCAGQLCAETAASKSLDINIVGHVLDKNTREHLPYISVVLKGTTIGVMTDASGHYFLKFWKTSVSTLYKGLWDNYPFLR